MEDMEHPFKLMNSKKTMTAGERFEACLNHVNRSIELPGCPRLKKRNNTSPFYSCKCLSPFEDLKAARESIAQYLVYFHGLAPSHRDRVIMDWIRQTASSIANDENNLDRVTPRFLVPFEPVDCNNKADLAIFETHRICKGALGLLFNFKDTKYTKLRKHVQNKTVPLHKGIGNQNKSVAFQEEVKDALRDFFERQIDLEGAPESTRIVRENTDSGLRDGEEGTVLLPPSIGKRGLYRRFMDERGYIVLTTAKGGLEYREKEGVEKLPYCSWFKFCSFWKSEYPLLKCKKASEDVCSYCYRVSQEFKRRTTIAEDESSEEEDGDSGVAEEEEEEEEPIGTGPRQRTLVFEPTRRQQEQAELYKEAAKHVEMAASMRSMANSKLLQARLTRSLDPHKRIFTLVMDYAQNCEIPHYGENQPGKSYYFSPLKVNIFGIVDASKDNHLYSYVYHEGVGKKGGNNVASMLFQHVHSFIYNKNLGQRAKELNIIADNCGGQNKNNMVIRLAPVLVEMGYFERVNFIFYVVGHTKNVCDSSFNTLKRVYRRKNLFTMDQNLQAFREGSTQDQVSILEVPSHRFVKWGEALDKMYKKIDPGWCSKGHIFTCSTETMKNYNDCWMEIETDDTGVGEKHKQLLAIQQKKKKQKKKRKTGKKLTEKQRKEDEDIDEYNKRIDESFAEVQQARKKFLDPSGLGLISMAKEPGNGIPIVKQIELGCKYVDAGIIDKEHLSNELYLRPSDEIIKQDKEDRKQRALLRKQRNNKRKREETRDEHSATTTTEETIAKRQAIPMASEII